MISEVLSFTLIALSSVFFVVDPFAVVPIFITMTARDSEEKRADMARRASIITACVLIFFALGGGLVFKLFGVTLAAFKIAGGVLLLITSLDMLKAHHAATKTSDAEIAEGTAKTDIAIVPLAMPLLAGPGSIATVMVLSANSKHLWEIGPIIFAILVTSLASYFILRSSTFLHRFLGSNGQAILSRVMGLMLAALSVQFMLNGMSEALPGLLAKLPKVPL